jgi:preprotein translocase subunit SecG
MGGGLAAVATPSRRGAAPAVRGGGSLCYPSAPRDALASEVDVPLNPILALAEIVISIGLMASILLQARGAGLSSAFGGDSAVYRSRRGIEKRLFQFTILLAILFVVFSLTVFRLVG